MSEQRIVELGCPGHFICSDRCRFRRHTQVGEKYRVSTVGDYYPNREGKRETVGAGDKSFFETYVFVTTGKPAEDNEGCGCIEVKSFCEIDGQRWETAGEAQRGHEAFVAKYKQLAAKRPRP